MAGRRAVGLDGYHECCVVDHPSQRDDRVAAWVRDGLLAGERAVHIEAPGHEGGIVRLLERLGVDARQRLRRGQLVVATPQEAYLADGVVDAPRRMALHAAYVAKTVADGFPALRVSGESALGLAIDPDPATVVAHESLVEDLTRAHPLSVLCVYDRARWGPSLASISRAHPRAVSDPQFRARAEPGRVVIDGEVDFSNAELVGGLLRDASPSDGRLTVDLSGLAFIDVAGTRKLVDLARRLSPMSRIVILDPPRQLGLIAWTGGWTAELGLAG